MSYIPYFLINKISPLNDIELLLFVTFMLVVLTIILSIISYNFIKKNKKLSKWLGID